MTADAQIDLAGIAPFALGALTVEPSTLRVIAGQIETLEPRVMQVLVALKQAGGATVSRDQLIERCWGGRVVGDDAINRVIGRLRKLAEANGGAGFRIETVPRVGYRLLDDRPVAAAVQPEPQMRTKRQWRPWAAGTAVAAIAGIALVAYPRHGGVEPTVLIAPITGPQPLADALRRDMLATEISGVRLVGDGMPPYRLAGTLARDDRGATLFVTLTDREGALWQTRLPIDPARPGATASHVSIALQCIAIAAARRTPERAAFLAYARYCAENTQPTSDETRQLAYLREAATDPHFVVAQQDLATFMGGAALSRPEPAAAAYRLEGLKAARNAQRDAPDDVLTSYGQYLLQRRTDFRGRAAIATRAAQRDAGPDGLGFQLQGHFFAAVGRTAEAYAAYQQRLAVMPDATIDGLLAPTMLARQGRYDDAKALYIDQEKRFGLHQRLARYWLAAALASGDAPTVARIAPFGEPDERVRGAVTALAAAKARGDNAAVAGAGDQLVALMAVPGALDGTLATALAVAGRDREALRAVELLFQGNDAGHASDLLYWPAFAGVRRLPEFPATAARMGLLDYWRHAEVRPDFCSEPGAQALCATLPAKDRGAPE